MNMSGVEQTVRDIHRWLSYGTPQGLVTSAGVLRHKSQRILDKGFPSSEDFKESTFSKTFSLLEYSQGFHLHEGLDPNVPPKSFVLKFGNDEKNVAELLSSPQSIASIFLSLGSSSK